MGRTFEVLTALCLWSFVLVSCQHDHKVKVAVYYESLCPDSIQFITKQLYPALQIPEIKKHVNLTLIPYGKSNTTKEGNGYTFQCHHGPDECKGNKIHACALAKIPPGNDGDRKVTVDFINCLLAKVTRSPSVDFPVKSCAESENVPVQAEIDNCAASTEGNQFLEIQGQKTQALQNPLLSVPTVVFNEKLDATVNADAQKNFIAALCKYIDHDKPAECEKSSAGIQQPIGIALLTLVVALRMF